MKRSKKKSDAHLNIRLPDAEKVAYETAAAKRGLDVTTWVRIHLRRAAGLDA